MKHKILKALVIFLSIALVIAGTLFYAMYIAPENIKINHKSISSEKIPKSIHDVNIAYISDIQYGEFVDEKRFRAVVEKINEASPDIILFGGDLFSNAEAFLDDPDTVSKVTEILTDIEAPLGKFYVLGEKDLKNENTKVLISKILYNAGYEDLTNKNIKIHNGTSEGFNLVGIDSIVGGTPDIEKAYTNLNNTTFTIAFTHAPDVYADIPNDSTDLAFAGHSHGGQISLPILGPLSTIDGAKKYERGTYEINELIIEVSNGIGTTNVDMRLFSPPEILIYRLVKK
ncbi:putative MPP superfamily phosphohydrolase [Breznakia sp. PF5-3]|uniref:metallophosphoesterase n=1 Tax=unclassified Breznakia TaxID=2623764 RepID=UPI0024051C13|nr:MULTISPECIES: metallophosphoesterase [unclassified Breznakia]MDF9823736.1 putative MPP superfamily phosphohydrolase [Breznakia sp. PM6-1]MDF9834534.1 putative MPP superfamily phosphohydrolase [Breznakia sp. PF5-3]MDF9838710.1 putative MPP superfamily phosphohydrolase [Breznakia sp. PFB2-8]MDF9860741.1 putative MPP superfamily phosphohydrolase [Breznakia sp. PH5-24]